MELLKVRSVQSNTVSAEGRGILFSLCSCLLRLLLVILLKLRRRSWCAVMNWKMPIILLLLRGGDDDDDEEDGALLLLLLLIMLLMLFSGLGGRESVILGHWAFTLFCSLCYVLDKKL
jgi:hypothetical protein